MVFLVSYTNVHKIRSRQLRDLKLGGLIAYIQFHNIYDFPISATSNDVMITSSLCFSQFVFKTCQSQPITLKLCKLIVYPKFHKICKFQNHVTRNEVIMMSLPKAIENNRKMRTSAKPNKLYIARKVLMRAIQKCNFYGI